ncbi:hypothetical protein HYS94_03815 [Candidatus Daviesbacteria bacterium]|nr:hypothetical protein [Candidatus Daviesbacteria bacterium]
MLSPEQAAQVARITEDNLLRLRHPQYGWSSALGRHEALHGRDLGIGGLVLLNSLSPELIPEWFIESTEVGIDVLTQFQGTRFDPEREEEEGVLPHEYRNGYTPRFRMEQLRATGWPVEEKPDGSLEMRYYGARDVNALIIKLIASLARVKEGRSEGEGRIVIEKYWPSILAMYRHDTGIADSSGYGLIDSIPKNLKTLFNLTEKDNDLAYITEDREVPRPPHIFLSLNCHFVDSLSEFAWMAQVRGEFSLAEDAMRRHYEGKRKIHQLFWMKDKGFYSPVIDGEGNQVKIMTDDVVHGLWCKTFAKPFADQVIERLQKSDFHTKRWGTRSKSSDSRQFVVNGPSSYWNGVWPHHVGIAAFGAENYGHTDFAEELDRELAQIIIEKGCVETGSVDYDGTWYDYTEGGKPAACIPQFWAAAVAWSRANRCLLSAA